MMKLSKIEIFTPSDFDRKTLSGEVGPCRANIQLRFLKSNGEAHRLSIAYENLDKLEDLITFNAKTVEEEINLNGCGLIRAMADANHLIAPNTEVEFMEFHCGPEAIVVDNDGNKTERFNPRAFILQAKTKDKIKGDGQAMRVSFSERCPESGEWLERNIDTDAACEKIPTDFKGVFNAVQSIKTKNGVKKYQRLGEIQQRKREMGL